MKETSTPTSELEISVFGNAPYTFVLKFLSHVQVTSKRVSIVLLTVNKLTSMLLRFGVLCDPTKCLTYSLVLCPQQSETNDAPCRPRPTRNTFL